MKRDHGKTDLAPDKLIERYRRAKARRSQWEGHWRECRHRAPPFQGNRILLSNGCPTKWGLVLA